jgi:hypothetical protein
VSIDRGAHWSRWKSVPTVAVYDLVVHPRDNDLILATHGRSFLVLDDITPVQQLSAATLGAASHVFEIGPAVQYIPNENGWFIGGRAYRAPNRALGTFVNYYLKSDAKGEVTIAVSDASGKVIRQLKGPKDAGLHRVAWDLRTEPVGASNPGLAGAFVLTNLGPFVIPGDYTIQVTIDGRSETRTAKVLPDPLATISDTDRETLFKTLTTLTDMQKTVGTAGDTVVKLDQRMQQVGELMKSHSSAPAAVTTAVASLAKQITTLRGSIAGRGGQGGGGGGEGEGGGQPLRNRINGLKSEVIGSQSLPTVVQTALVETYRKQLADLVGQLNTVITTGLPGLYKQLNENRIFPGGDAISPVPTSSPAQ